MGFLMRALIRSYIRKTSIRLLLFIGVSTSILAPSIANAGWLKKAIVGSALVGVGYSAGSSGSEAQRAPEPLLRPNESLSGTTNVSKAEQNRLNAMEKVTWKLLKKGDFENPLLPKYAAKLSESNDLAKLDASAFAYAELGDKEAAISIYQEKIVMVFRSTEVSEIEIEIYDKRYSVLEECAPQKCVSVLYGQ